VDLTEQEVATFYSGFCNQTLWPLLHCFPSAVQWRGDDYHMYRRINQAFASQLFPLLRPSDVIWVHDYHLLPLGAALRRFGWRGRLGFFLHTPFPPLDIFTILPAAQHLLKDCTAYDLMGFHIQRYLRNFSDALTTELGGTIRAGVYQQSDCAVQLGAYAIGTDPDVFAHWASQPQAVQRGERLRRSVGGRRIILGVDRLDYTKGIPERLCAFARLLERYPSWRKRVVLIQISAPSRTTIPEYTARKKAVEELVGNINGRFSDDDWIPIRYLYRTYSQEELAAFYRAADVCVVTPLRDGMNLVAKEYIAAQGSTPGVLLLSQFCGAAEDLREAVLTNPYDIDGTAAQLNSALRLPLSARRARWLALLTRVQTHTAYTWSQRFLVDLMQAGRSASPPFQGKYYVESTSLATPTSSVAS
jgi:trehalose 6-phosphate synthase